MSYYDQIGMPSGTIIYDYTVNYVIESLYASQSLGPGSGSVNVPTVGQLWPRGNFSNR